LAVQIIDVIHVDDERLEFEVGSAHNGLPF
jgi:hypothetical protein